MMKPITGQYECVHSSGVGLDYFTSRIDRLVIQNNGRFVLTTQNHSRVSNAAKSFLQGQQAPTTVAETRLEGSYTHQELLVVMQFDNGGNEQAHLAADGSAMQIGPNYFTKVSDSTLLPPTHRLKKDMDDINKGLKIAGTIGGMAVKASKMIKGTIESTQGTNATPAATPPPAPSTPPAQTGAPVYVPPTPQSAPIPAAQPLQQSTAAQPGQASAIFCDQCGARIRPGKRFCNVCGARFM